MRLPYLKAAFPPPQPTNCCQRLYIRILNPWSVSKTCHDWCLTPVSLYTSPAQIQKHLQWLQFYRPSDFYRRIIFNIWTVGHVMPSFKPPFAPFEDIQGASVCDMFKARIRTTWLLRVGTLGGNSADGTLGGNSANQASLHASTQAAAGTCRTHLASYSVGVQLLTQAAAGTYYHPNIHTRVQTQGLFQSSSALVVESIFLI